MAKKKVLIVEDDLILSMLNAHYVELLGHDVVKKVKSGEEAIEYTSENHVDIILMDIRLKGIIDGIEAVNEINRTKNIPAVYITGNSDEETRKRAEQSNMIQFCTKPLNFEELEEILGKV